MKKLLIIISIIFISGCCIYWKYFLKTKIITPIIIQKQTESVHIPEQTKIKPEQTQNNDTEEKKLKDKYENLKAEFKEKSAEYKTACAAYETLEKKGAEDCDYMSDLKTQAERLQSEGKKLLNKVKELDKQINEAKASAKHGKESIFGKRSKKDAKWCYVDSPGTLYPYSKLKSRDKKRRIKYVYTEDDRGEKEAEKYTEQAKKLEQEKEQIKTQIETKKNQYTELTKHYKEQLERKKTELKDQLDEIKKKGKQIKQELVKN
jgi:chromosome segregation ATPase